MRSGSFLDQRNARDQRIIGAGLLFGLGPQGAGRKPMLSNKPRDVPRFVHLCDYARRSKAEAAE
jgi:hypothetical protein